VVREPENAGFSGDRLPFPNLASYAPFDSTGHQLPWNVIYITIADAAKSGSFGVFVKTYRCCFQHSFAGSPINSMQSQGRTFCSKT
jgi:hypothetical protein